MLLSNADLEFDQRHIWHPYTSMTHPLPCYPVVAANGYHLQLDDGRELVDGMSSWWAAIHGYNHPRLNQALQQQIGQMSYVMADGEWQPQVMAIERQLRAELTPLLDAERVADVRVLGAIGVLETTSTVNVARVQRFFVERCVWIRPFGKLLYVMPPYIISPEALTRLTSALRDAIRSPSCFNNAQPHSQTVSITAGKVSGKNL